MHDDALVARGVRVALRRPREADRAEFSALVVASHEFLARWAQGAPPAEDPEGLRWFDATLAQAASGRSEKLFVVRARDGALLGALNFNEIVRGAFESAYLGYWIGAAHARQGLMGEALELALTWGFGPLGLHRMEANIQPGNEPSIALVRRAGFVREGFSERYLKVGGVWRDHERWAITREAWERG